jgi:chromosome segregation ATPase
MTEMAINQNCDRLKLRIKYLEKDNKDLQMDLEDVEATLQINKNIINSLIDTRSDLDSETSKLIKKFQREVEIANERSDRLQIERDEIKAKLLVAEQLGMNVKSKEEEITTHYEIEMKRLIDQVEKKEYTLQLLEQRLFDCEKFLRKWGREDPFIRDQLKMLKINPDLRK